MFLQACIVPLLRAVEPIKIKVIHTIPRNYVKFNQCVGRAFHGPAVAERTQQAAGEGGLARTEVTREVNHEAGPEHACQRRTERECRRLVR